jgi:hypothetical protein
MRYARNRPITPEEKKIFSAWGHVEMKLAIGGAMGAVTALAIQHYACEKTPPWLMQPSPVAGQPATPVQNPDAPTPCSAVATPFEMLAGAALGAFLVWHFG